MRDVVEVGVKCAGSVSLSRSSCLVFIFLDSGRMPWDESVKVLAMIMRVCLVINLACLVTQLSSADTDRYFSMVAAIVA